MFQGMKHLVLVFSNEIELLSINLVETSEHASHQVRLQHKILLKVISFRFYFSSEFAFILYFTIDSAF